MFGFYTSKEFHKMRKIDYGFENEKKQVIKQWSPKYSKIGSN